MKAERRKELFEWRFYPWLVVGLLASLWLWDLARVWRITNHHDLDVFMRAARRLVAGEDIYQDLAPFKAALERGTFSMKDETVVWPYAYAPLIAILFVPALALPYSLVRALWWGVNVLALSLGSLLTLRALSRVTPLLLGLALLLLYRFDPAVVTLRLGQIELVQFFLLALALYALSRGRDPLAGGALGLATALKFFPGALIGLFLWRRRWRAALWALAVACVGIGASFALVGWEAVSAYWHYTSIYGLGGAFAAFPYNQSFNGFFSRNLISNVFSPTLKGVNLPGLAKGLTLLCDGVVVLASAYLTWHREGWPCSPCEGDHQRFSLEFALGVVALLLVSPHSQVYTLVWTLLPLLVLVHKLLADSAPWWQWGVLFVAYLLIGRHYVFFHPGLTRLVQAHYLFGLLSLWGLLAFILWRERGQRSLAPSCSSG